MVSGGLVIEESRLTFSDKLRTGNHHLEYLCRCVYGVVVSQRSLRSLFLLSVLTWPCPPLARLGTLDSPPVFALPSLSTFCIYHRFLRYNDPGDPAERSHLVSLRNAGTTYRDRTPPGPNFL